MNTKTTFKSKALGRRVFLGKRVIGFTTLTVAELRRRAANHKAEARRRAREVQRFKAVLPKILADIGPRSPVAMQIKRNFVNEVSLAQFHRTVWHALAATIKRKVEPAPRACGIMPEGRRA